MSILTDQEIRSRLNTLLGWQFEDRKIFKTVKCANFQEALAFVIRVGFLAESADHHPDIAIQYSKVTLRLSTHSAGGLTEKDFSLATKIDLLKI